MEVCHTKLVCEVHTQKEDPYRTRITIGGNHIIYPGDVGTPTASLELVKLILNSVLSRPGENFSCFDVKISTLRPPWSDQSMCASRLRTFLRNSSMSTTYCQLFTIDGYILRLSEVDMAYLNQECWPTTCCAHASKKKDTSKQPPPLDYGSTSGDQFSFV